MVAEESAFLEGTHIDPDDPDNVARWAEHWGVSPPTILNAIRKVGPLVRDVAVEIWKII